jgi:hypothetical protein
MFYQPTIHVEQCNAMLFKSSKSADNSCFGRQERATEDHPTSHHPNKRGSATLNDSHKKEK